MGKELNIKHVEVRVEKNKLEDLITEAQGAAGVRLGAETAEEALKETIKILERFKQRSQLVSEVTGMCYRWENSDMQSFIQERVIPLLTDEQLEALLANQGRL